jgi:hypothetical protein
MAADTASADPTGTSATARSGGRKRDETRNAAILEATIDVLVDHGFERMTVIWQAGGVPPLTVQGRSGAGR